MCPFYQPSLRTDTGGSEVRACWQDDGVTENLTIDDTATRWSSPDRAGMPLLVLLHGYGADEHDLFGLVPYLPSGIAVASVAAPLAPPWPMPGRSWYAIDGLDGRSPEAVTVAAEAFLRWLDAAAGDSPSVALLGFSQGAAVSLQALRLAPERFGAVVALSGYAAPGDLPGDETLTELRPPVFWGRGTHDDVIPPALVDHTAQWLPGHADLSGRVYTGLTHSISEEELADVRRFLTKWIEGIGADQEEGPRPA
jgi:phospholipase/carboxylesterase